ncbi:hypothetical protein [Streptococcus gallinaceus]|uniref:DUF1310 family protein n=1 Tax=Streptococcus gallinaceus TaxID=165758 RepID=A0ABV2JJ85_9STRE
MSKRKKFTIGALLCLLVGGIIMFSLNHIKQEEIEANRNREYEISLVNALKNSYSDLEFIKISNSVKTVKPGDWSCFVELVFTNGDKVKYNLEHSREYEINRGGILSEQESNILANHQGITTQQVKVTYSNESNRVI